MRELRLTCAKMSPAGLPATTGWQPVLPRSIALAPLESLRAFFESNPVSARLCCSFLASWRRSPSPARRMPGQASTDLLLQLESSAAYNLVIDQNVHALSLES